MKNVIFIEPKSRSKDKKKLLQMVLKAFIRVTIIMMMAILLFYSRETIHETLISKGFTDMHHFVEMLVNAIPDSVNLYHK